MGGPPVSAEWTHLYQDFFFLWVWPPPGLGNEADFELVDAVVVKPPPEIATGSEQADAEKDDK